MATKKKAATATPLPDDLAAKLPPMPDEMKQKFDEIKQKLETFKTKILEKFDKYILGISLLPPEKQPFEQNQLPPGTPAPNPNDISVFVLVNDADSDKANKYDLRDKLLVIMDKLALEIDKNIKPEVMLLTELRESLFDAKYEVLRLIGMSAPIYDPKDLLAALRISEVHKSMVIKKFEKYVVSYVAVGSMFRGDAKSNDIDVAVIIDDTDVKRMSRGELRDKLGAIIRSMGYEASAITGVKKSFHIQVYILTDYWESIKEANPVIFTFLRDGVPLYDRGTFMPWKLLLEMGRIKPSPEAIDMFMDMGTRLVNRAKGRMIGIVAEDIYYAVLNPSQAALMMYGIPPPTPKETVKLLEEIFVKKEKILEQKYVDTLEKIRKYYKDIEHGTLTEITGKELDELMAESEAYLKRIDQLFKQIEKQADKQIMNQFKKNFEQALRDVLQEEKIKVTGNLEKDYQTAINKEIIPETFKKNVHDIQKLGKNLTRFEQNKIIRENTFLIRILTEHLQRKKGVELERARIRIKYGEKYADIYLLENEAYLIEETLEGEKKVNKATITPKGGITNMQDSNLAAFEHALASITIPPKTYIKHPLFEDLKRIYGDDIEIQVTK
ncbi:MAG: hypothetical protein Q7R56_02610 [Nanoarchaeota archaeon]|nr:hypothetical protein [Nanoarchaeota archaeon]